MERRIYQVGELNTHLRTLFEADPLLNDLWVRGEISNYKHHSSGHHYFTLKDQSGRLRCVLFRSQGRRLTFLPADGMRVLARGYISIYERDGLYQFYTQEMAPDGQGALYQAFCQLKERLQKEGLFAPEHKRGIPYLPRRVGVVTSQTGAAWHDIMKVIRRRFPEMPVVLAPSAVQGQDAPEEICAALQALNDRQDIDVIIMGRGGGSLEELWSFNTEAVARAIFCSRIPVVSAVGHETDYTIADLVADLRAPTPSAAAEMVVPRRDELEAKLQQYLDRINLSFCQKLQAAREDISSHSVRNLGALLSRTAYINKQKVGHYSSHLIKRTRLIEEQNSREIQALTGKLEALSPLQVLDRGYSMCLDAQSKELIQDSSKVQVGDQVSVILQKGRLDCDVRGTKEETDWSSSKN
ncbi:MAG: exodeoxyribonuclease VII large subunit [Syntrophaceticus sp.]|nr:exodeoxyribonuclease VII large subunit [Syntrophaceticus sp.]MDD3315294.1 exodeoxyribonuclease VII large subunit [Syntrophaceticus sp.]MDD4782945.1 exodeoxyribonuclease VII large subunit [Syntrophaceticus sp.]